MDRRADYASSCAQVVPCNTRKSSCFVLTGEPAGVERRTVGTKTGTGVDKVCGVDAGKMESVVCAGEDLRSDCRAKGAGC